MHYHVYGLGNALVDMEYEIDDGFLTQREIAKGHMTLVEAERLLQLSGDLADHTPRRCSGGSAANSLMAVTLPWGHRQPRCAAARYRAPRSRPRASSGRYPRSRSEA